MSKHHKSPFLDINPQPALWCCLCCEYASKLSPCSASAQPHDIVVQWHCHIPLSTGFVRAFCYRMRRMLFFFFFNTRKTCLEMSDLFPESQWKVTEYSVLGQVNSLLSKLTGFRETFPFSLNGIVQQEEKPEGLCHKTCGCLSGLGASVQAGLDSPVQRHGSSAPLSLWTAAAPGQGASFPPEGFGAGAFTRSITCAVTRSHCHQKQAGQGWQGIAWVHKPC